MKNTFIIRHERLGRVAREAVRGAAGAGHPGAQHDLQPASEIAVERVGPALS